MIAAIIFNVMEEISTDKKDEVVEDLSAVKNAEIESRIQKEVFVEGERIASLGAWEYDVETNQVLWSEGVYAIFNIKRDLPLPIEKCISYYIPKDRKRIQQALEDVIAHRRAYDIECEIISGSGEHKFIRAIGRVGALRGERVRSIIGVVRDVTQRQTLQKGLEAFFHLTPDLVGVLDFDGKPINLSPSWESALGWTLAELRACGIDALVHADDRERVRQLLKSMATSERIKKCESRVVSKSGELRWVSWRIFADRPTERVFISARDITESKYTEKALIEAKLQAEEANRAKSDFLAVMSHELRTPLNPILGFTDLLLEETENPEHCNILRIISESGQSLTKVIGNVLDFAKIESGRVEVRSDLFDMQHLVGQCAALMAGQIDGDSVSLNYNVELGSHFSAGQRFIGDEDKISRILTNLIGNAIKFTDQGAVYVDCSINGIDSERAILHVDVTDTGIGMTEASMEELFEPFKQVDSSSTRRHGGTGLGLSICKRLANLMGGEITVRSELHEGSTFTFILPLGVGAVSRAKAVPSEGKTVGIDTLRIESAPHVLLVEDDATNTLYAKCLLERMGCTVTAAASGEEALAQYSAAEHTIILLDLHMPGMGGMDVLKSIRRSEANDGLNRAPILILTANVLADTREACLSNGADAVVYKPLGPRELVVAIEGLLMATP